MEPDPDSVADPDADPGPATFVIDLQETIKKQIFNKIFGLLLFEGTFTSFTSFFKDEKSKRSHKTVGIKVFLTIFA
jgi:hypothetical protein